MIYISTQHVEFIRESSLEQKRATIISITNCNVVSNGGTNRRLYEEELGNL